MFKKVVPIAALLSSAVAVDNYVQNSAWTGASPAVFSGTAGTQPNGNEVQASATTCCFFTGALTITSANVLSGTVATPANCGAYTLTNTNQLSVTLADPTTSTTATKAAAPAVTVLTDNTGVATLQVTTATPSAVTATSPVCKQTISTRADTVAPADLAGTWTIGAAGATTGNAATCCYFDASTKMTFTKGTGNVITTSGGKTQTQTANANCPSSQTEYTKTLVQLIGDTTSAVPLLYNGDKFTLNAAKTQLTYIPLGNTACTQTFTKDSSSSALNIAMAPVAVGAAVMGLVL